MQIHYMSTEQAARLPNPPSTFTMNGSSGSYYIGDAPFDWNPNPYWQEPVITPLPYYPPPQIYPWVDGAGTGQPTTTRTDAKELTFDDLVLGEDMKLNFEDISSEEYRTYHYADGSMVVLVKPIALAVTQTGHRVLTADGESHYIMAGFQRISWKSAEGAPHFVK
jgi:hypothetical protein